MDAPGSERLSAVIACHGDAPAVPLMHERLTKMFESLGLNYEIIFVNDGSPDNAAEVLADLVAHDPKVTVITHSRAFGSQAAFTSGMELATGDAVILFDGDLQDPPELVPDFVAKWREGYEVVYGERVEREMGRTLGWVYKLFYRLFRRVSYVNIPLDAGDFSLIDRKVVEALKGLPEKQRFVRGLRAWVGFRQTGVPYRRPERPFGTSTNSVIKNLGWARRAIVSFSYAPLDVLAWFGMITVGVSFLGAITTLTLRIVDPHQAPAGITTVLLVILFLGGVQLLAISVIGSYLAHMYDEVKGRPTYVVAEITNPPHPRDPPADITRNPSA